MTVLYVHPLCYSSYKLVKEGLETLRAHDVELRSVENPLESGVLRGEVVSVPYLVKEGKPLAVDPLDAGELKLILEKGKAIVYEPWKMLARSILASGYLTSLAILHGPSRLPRLLPRGFVEAALRSNVGGPPLGDVEGEEFWARVWNRVWEKAGIVVAYNYARHTYWSRRLLGRKPSPEELETELASSGSGEISRWLVAMSSLGRAGNLTDFGERSAVERVVEVVEAARRVLVDGGVARWIVVEEQGVIEGDIGFWRAFEELVAGGVS